MRNHLNFILLFRKPLAFAKKEFLTDISYTLSFFMRWCGIVISAFTFYYISKLIGGQGADHFNKSGLDYFSFVLVGLAVVSYLNATLSGFVSSVTREQSTGMLEVFLMAPTGLPTIFFSIYFYNSIMGLLGAGFYILLGAVFFHVHLHAINIPATFVVIFLSTVTFVCFGMIIVTGIITLRKGDPITVLITNFLWIMGGLYFPIEVLPESFQVISWYLPSTYVLKALRLATLEGYSVAMLKDEIVILFAFAVLSLTISLLIFNRTMAYVRKRGTAVLY